MVTNLWSRIFTVCFFHLAFFLHLAPIVLGQSARPSVDEIVARHMVALGGREKIDAIHSVVQHLEYREASFVIPDAFIARMRPYYKTIGDPKDKTVDVNEGYDGSAWEYYADPGIVIRTVGAAAAAARHGTEIIDSLVDYQQRGTQIEMLGSETFAGSPAYKLRVTLADGFAKDLFIDQKSFLIVGDRRSAPIHAFGESVASENRIGDYRQVNGVLFPYSIHEVEIATGKELNSNTVQTMEVNKEFDLSFFGPPQYDRTPLQQMLEQLYMERTDPVCVMWTYRGFRAANPNTDTRSGVEFIGYQMLKMSAFDGAIKVLTANAADYPKSASAEFGLARAYKAAGDLDQARIHFQRALEIDPKFKKASDGLNALK
jgi:tetratricopeptide (TPR) repeat protein